MASLQASCYICSSSSPMPSLNKRGAATMAINLDVQRSRTSSNVISLHNLQMAGGCFGSSLIEKQANSKSLSDPMLLVMEKLYAILEIVADRVEMHKNIGQQREDWNRLLLTSINAITLAATTTSAIAVGAPSAALKVSSTLMFLAATGMLVIMNKIQPSQLAEEQRNAARLFKQLQNQIQTKLMIGNPTEADVNDAMDKILALDRAYPLPLLGVMLEKFPSEIKPAVWWPQQKQQPIKEANESAAKNINGWNSKLEKEMKSVVGIMRRKDKADYLRLGGKALKLNKILALSGPLLTCMAAIGSAVSVGCSNSHQNIGSWGAMVGIICGGLASLVNAMEHGGQVGMVFEMYRSNAGFFKLMEESIESELMKVEGGRENGELFELKTALKLGRSPSELRDLAAAAAAAAAAASSRSGDDELVEEFASKLF